MPRGKPWAAGVASRPHPDGERKSPVHAFIDTGDHVIVVNAEKVTTTGLKAEQKKYQHYTGYPGGLRTEDFRKRFARKPEMVIESAVEAHASEEQAGEADDQQAAGVSGGEKHPHEAQKPVAKASGVEIGSSATLWRSACKLWVRTFKENEIKDVASCCL